jgi:hypothetical protein
MKKVIFGTLSLMSSQFLNANSNHTDEHHSDNENLEKEEVMCV